MEYKKIFEEFKVKLNALTYAIWLIGWDLETEAPKGGIDYKNKQRLVLSEQAYNLMLDPKRVEAIKHLHNSDLEDPFKREIELEYKSILKTEKIPKDLYMKYQEAVLNSSVIYREAKEKSDFELFEPYLDEVIKLKKETLKYLETDKLKGYDVFLNDYHEGLTVKDYDKFFNLLKEELVPFVEKLEQKKLNYNNALITNKFNTSKQKEFNNYLLNVFGYDLNHGLLKESIHPFTSGITPNDVRITTAYYEEDLSSAIFSTIHEMGHGIYEQQMNKEYEGTKLGRVESLGMHESQSRLYENMIGRSYEFWENHFSKLKEIFKEELKDVTVEDFHLYMNEVQKDFIRVDADELTYSLHILIRYEIEKKIFNEDLQTSEIKDLWNKLYKEHLGLTVKEDRLGVLQDIHWSGGAFGYFPSYALGSAIAAQVYNKMDEDIDVSKLVKEDNILEINKWLKKHIHQYGSYKVANDLILDSTGEPFDARYYINYLIEKYSKIYNI